MLIIGEKHTNDVDLNAKHTYILQSKSLWQTDFSLLQSSVRPTRDDRRGTMKVVIREAFPASQGPTKP